MKAITLWQPYASLVAVGAKTIETRSWAAPESLIGQPLLIHAAQKCDDSFTGGGWWVGGGPRLGRGVPRFLWGPLDGHDHACATDHPCRGHAPIEHARSLPLGAVVASCTLADVVPILGPTDDPSPGRDEWVTHVAPHVGGPLAGQLAIWRDTWRIEPIESQRPFGDFSPGRFAWLLEDVKPTTARCPRCWGRIRVERWANSTGEIGHRRVPGCSTCSTRGVCAPVPMRGRQRLWTVRDEDWPETGSEKE